MAEADQLFMDSTWADRLPGPTLPALNRFGQWKSASGCERRI